MSDSSKEKNRHEEGPAQGHDELVHLSLTDKELERQRLQAEVEAFLANGGAIREIPENVLADPPKKPESNYGGQPI